MLLKPGIRSGRGERPAPPFRVNRESAQLRSLIAWYPFAGGTADKRSLIVGPGELVHVGSGSKVPTVASIMGLVPESDGLDHGFGLPDVSALLPTAGTFSMWVRLHVHTPAVNPNGSWYLGGSGNNFYFYPYLDGNIYDGCFADARNTIGPGLIADRTLWHLVTITNDGTTYTFYQNARSAFSTASGFNVALPTTWSIGWNNSTGLDGQYTDARIYNRALTPMEVWALYDPATRWDLYAVSSSRLFFDVGASAITAAQEIGIFDQQLAGQMVGQVWQ